MEGATGRAGAEGRGGDSRRCGAVRRRLLEVRSCKSHETRERKSREGVRRGEEKMKLGLGRKGHGGLLVGCGGHRATTRPIFKCCAGLGRPSCLSNGPGTALCTGPS